MCITEVRCSPGSYTDDHVVKYLNAHTLFHANISLLLTEHKEIHIHIHTMLCLSCRDCYQNNGLYHALQLETMFNINSFLNRTSVSVHCGGIAG